MSCSTGEQKTPPFTQVEMEVIYQDTFSIRAITIMENNLAFAGDRNLYGIYNADSRSVRTSHLALDTLKTEFRAVAGTDADFFMLSVGNPALLFKTGDQGRMELVYREDHPSVFYDAMSFWNAQEGIAMGDPTDSCLSILITRDGGKHWTKLECSVLPEVAQGEAAFAASNTNIKTMGDHTWIATGGARSRVFYSPDKGRTWQVFETPVVQGVGSQGIYSMDFYDPENGFVIGGDYTSPEGNTANKARTSDGGRTWQLVGNGTDPGYMSCVQYVPGGRADQLVACGFQGVYYSEDGGEHWTKLSDEGFYTLRFLNAQTAYAAGKNRIALLKFK